ncbi:hypothetical protein [Streptomyces sp. NPDC090036]|uniref:hypothetical protein n=1 Tax=Streptomyces sp. NPDC090036 TaxID=3365926 RepID=UPI0038120A7D
MPSRRSAKWRSRASLVRVPEGEPAARGTHQIYRLFGERRAGPGGPVWLTNMNRHRMDDLLHLVRGGRSTAVLGSLADDFGLLDFEGRSFPGWHHHMTLMSAAYAYALRQRQEHGGLGGRRPA